MTSPSTLGLYLTNDLLFSSAVTASAAAIGSSLELVMSASKLNERAVEPALRMVIVDLTAVGNEPTQVFETLRRIAPTAKLIAYGPHVDEALLNAAQAAGCDAVLTRGQFKMEHAAILRRLLVG